MERRHAVAAVGAHQIAFVVCHIGVFHDPFGRVGELEHVKDGLARFLFLFCHKGVESSFDVIFDGSHGTGGIQHDAQVDVIVFRHKHFLLFLIFEMIISAIISTFWDR